MKSNRFLTISLVFVLSLILSVGLFVNGFAQEDGKTYRIGLVFDVGGKGDKSFNDSAYRGLEWAKNGSDEFEGFEALSINFTTIEPGSGGAGREDAMRMMASQGFDLVIGVGFLFSDSTRSLAEEFPNINFAVVDYTPGEEEIPSNLMGLSFPEQQGSFLVGALAAMKTKTNKVGFVGGMKIPLIKKFEAGFKSGVWYVDPDLEISSKYVGTTGEAFANPAKGKEIAKAMYGDDVDVIYHAAGLSGSGVIEAAAEAGNYAIGVDSDQDYMAPGHVLTSMLKRVDVAVYKTVRDVVNGEFEGGVDMQFGLAEDGVGYAIDVFNRVEEFPEQVEQLQNEGTVTLPALGETQISPKRIDQLPTENLLTDSMIARADELKRQIIEGQFTVPSDPSNVTPEDPVQK
ncbi:MAG: BMP family lipoprotein [Candidatus Bipolaricaulota bacterium]